MTRRPSAATVLPIRHRARPTIRFTRPQTWPMSVWVAASCASAPVAWAVALVILTMTGVTA